MVIGDDIPAELALVAGQIGFELLDPEVVGILGGLKVEVITPPA